MHSFSEIHIEIRSRKTGKSYVLAPVSRVQLNELVETQIAKVCDEPEIYDNIFAGILKGKRYSEDHARTFTKLVSEGWNKNRFDWLILNEGTVVGTAGIKSLDGEIGYWQSNKHPGVMTIVVQSICVLAKDAGFSSLWAYVKKSNLPSVKVLEGAGFKLDKELTEKREGLYGYRTAL